MTEQTLRDLVIVDTEEPFESWLAVSGPFPSAEAAAEHFEACVSLGGKLEPELLEVYEGYIVPAGALVRGECPFAGVDDGGRRRGR